MRIQALFLIIVFVCQGLGQTITVNTGTSYQTFVGWEATAQIGCYEFIVSCLNWKNNVTPAAIDLGINRIRTEIPSGLVENSTNYYGIFLANNQDVVDNNTPVSWGNVFSNVRIPVNDNGDTNSINSSGFKFDVIDKQINDVIVPLKASLASQNETLFWTACYVHFSTSNQLHVDTPAEYGELILATWQHINSTYGYVPDGLEIFLEPDNGSAQVTSSEVAAMIIAARDRLVAAGFSKPYIIAPSMTIGQNAESYYAGIKSANATAAGYIDEISYHRYGTPPTTSEIASLRSVAETDGKNTAMTEFIAATYQTLYDDLKSGKVSAWQQYTLAYPLEGTDDGSKYFYIDGSNNVVIGSRTKQLKQFFKYIRRNAVMKGVTNSNGSYLGLPFRNSNGSYVVPIWANGTNTVTVSGLPAGTYGLTYALDNGTTGSFSNQTISGGQNVTFSLSSAGVATVYDVNFMASAGVNCKWFGAVKPLGCL